MEAEEPLTSKEAGGRGRVRVRRGGAEGGGGEGAGGGGEGGEQQEERGGPPYFSLLSQASPLNTAELQLHSGCRVLLILGNMVFSLRATTTHLAHTWDTRVQVCRLQMVATARRGQLTPDEQSPDDL